VTEGWALVNIGESKEAMNPIDWVAEVNKMELGQKRPWRVRRTGVTLRGISWKMQGLALRALRGFAGRITEELNWEFILRQMSGSSTT
jgi:hypothetical protein